MKSKFRLIYSEEFSRRAQKLIKKQPSLKSKLKKSLSLLSADPFSPQLRSHKVYTKKYGEAYSARVTGDIRIFWKQFEKEIILVVTIGTHEGKLKVYK